MKSTNLIQLPPEALNIINELNSNGYEAFAVGGCVRDGLLGRDPQDWDIATNAVPERVKDIFRNTIDTGIKHGTVTVHGKENDIEVTTYRIDGTYKDNRHPENVEFTASLREDLKRRDFTMNAIAFHPDHGIIDLFGGIADIEEGIIKSVGMPEERFSEDALRMLRAARFSAQLGFRVDESVLDAIKEKCGLIKNVSSERVRDELDKLLVSDYPMRFILLRDTNLLQYILPEFEVCFHTVQKNPYHIFNVAVHSLKVVEAVPNDRVLRWAALLHDVGKPFVKTTDEKGIDHFYDHQLKGARLAEVILRRLRFDNNNISKITKLIQYHDMEINPSHKSVRKAAAKIGRNLFEALLYLKEGDRRAQAPQYLEAGLEKVRKVRQIYSDIVSMNEVIDMRGLAVNGHDLMEAGVRQGPELRQVLEKLLEAVLEDPRANTKERLLELAKGWHYYDRSGNEAHD